MRRLNMSGSIFIMLMLLAFVILITTENKFTDPMFAPTVSLAALMHSFWVGETTDK